MGKYFQTFIRLQKKYILTFIGGSIIISLLVLRRGFQYGDMFQSLIDGIANNNQQVFLYSLLILISVELILFFSRMVVYDVVKVKCR